MKFEITDEKIHPMLLNLKPVIISFAKTFGENCEVVLHDLKNPIHSVVMVANGHVTGRKVGQSFRDLIHSVLRSKRFKDDHLANYLTITDDGKKIKSSTALIRDENMEVIAALCINYDIGKFMVAKKTIDDFCKTIEDEYESREDAEDVLHEDIYHILQRIIKGVIEENSIPISMMNKEEKKNIVRFLDEKGVFLIKGAIDRVADEIGVSRYTIYNYLEEIRSGKK